VTIFKHVTPVF